MSGPALHILRLVTGVWPGVCPRGGGGWGSTCPPKTMMNYNYGLFCATPATAMEPPGCLSNTSYHVSLDTSLAIVAMEPPGRLDNTSYYTTLDMPLATVTTGSIYLQAHTDPLGECALWERGLHGGHHCAAQDAPLGANQVAVLLDTRHHRKVLWEIPCDDAADALPLQLLGRVQL